MEMSIPIIVISTSISPNEIYKMTPAEIYKILNEISLTKKRDFNFEKEKLESIVRAVTLGIVNTRKKGKPYQLFENEKAVSSKPISLSEKRKEFEYLKKEGGF